MLIDPVLCTVRSQRMPSCLRCLRGQDCAVLYCTMLLSFTPNCTALNCADPCTTTEASDWPLRMRASQSWTVPATAASHFFSSATGRLACQPPLYLPTHRIGHGTPPHPCPARTAHQPAYHVCHDLQPTMARRMAGSNSQPIYEPAHPGVLVPRFSPLHIQPPPNAILTHPLLQVLNR